MSTYYAFHCNNCGRNGGFISRQMSGWGNFDIIDSFKFIAHHISECGHEHLSVISEHDDEYGDELDEQQEDAERLKFLEATAHIFPRSNDWEHMRKHEEGFNEAWVEQEKQKLTPQYKGNL